MPDLAKEAKALLSKINASARKKLGQNFMINDAVLSFIADAVQPDEEDVVLEIGPGLGFLTRHLVNSGARVLAVEQDKAYAAFLKNYFKGRKFDLIEKDILKTDFTGDFQLSTPVKVIGNIPYNITTPILEWLIQNRSQVTSAVLTTQFELAERLNAEPGTKTWGSISIFLQLYADVAFLKKIGPSAFYPSPRVDSAVIRIRFLDKPRYPISDETRFFELVHKAFQKRRKTILNALADERDYALQKDALSGSLKSCSIDAKRRPETLSVEEWAKLSEKLSLVICHPRKL